MPRNSSLRLAIVAGGPDSAHSPARMTVSLPTTRAKDRAPRSSATPSVGSAVPVGSSTTSPKPLASGGVSRAPISCRTATLGASRQSAASTSRISLLSPSVIASSPHGTCASRVRGQRCSRRHSPSLRDACSASRSAAGSSAWPRCCARRNSADGFVSSGLVRIRAVRAPLSSPGSDIGRACLSASSADAAGDPAERLISPPEALPWPSISPQNSVAPSTHVPYHQLCAPLEISRAISRLATSVEARVARLSSVLAVAASSPHRWGLGAGVPQRHVR